MFHSNTMTCLFVTTVLFALCTSAILAVDDKQMLLAELAKSSSDFSHKLYQKIATDKSNVVYSPYSIHSALSMTSLGARGTTLSEMRSVLGEIGLGEKTSDAYQELISELNSAQNVKLHTANAIFVQEGKRVDSTFVDEVETKYSALATNFDLSAQGGPEKIVNDYVAENTENMIEDILDKGTITQDTLLLLVNTIFFNGTWRDEFPKYRTRKQDFYELGGTKKQVDMMSQTGFFRYKMDTFHEADILEMPFKGNRFSLNIILPHDYKGIANIEKTLTTDVVNDIFRDLKRTNIKIGIPKFKIETKLNLETTLAQMGMRRAFNPFTADFSGITTDENTFINRVIHQAVIDVQEQGTVAAAATVVGISFTSLPLPTNFEFIADHPFLFFLRDSQTGQVLFQGKYSG